jgi:hypothetical protein
MSACYTFRLPDASRKQWLQQQLQQPNASQQAIASSRGVSAAGDAVAGFRAAQGVGLSHGSLSPGEDDDEDELEWDADAPWHPWAQFRDPVRALELDVVWQDRQITQLAEQQDQQQMIDSSTAAPAALSAAGMGALLGDAAAADHWLLHVLHHGYSSSPIRQGRLGMRSADRHRRHVSVAAAGGLVKGTR